MTYPKKLRELAEKATPGPWVRSSYVDAGGGRLVIAKGMPDIGHIRVSCPSVSDGNHSRSITAKQRDSDCDFIAAFDRETVIALLDRLEAAEAALGLFEIEDGQAVALDWLDMNLALARWRRIRDGQGGGDGE